MEFVLKNVRLWLTDTLHYPSKICFPQFLSKIIKCDVQRLWLRSITGISLKEYKILAQNVSKLTICPRIISDKSIGPLFSLEDIVSSTPNADEIEIISDKSIGPLLSLEDIVSSTPNAYEIDVSPCHVTSGTSEALLKIQHKTKLTVFDLRKIDNELDVEKMFLFIKRNTAPFSEFSFQFNNLTYSKNFKEILKTKVTNEFGDSNKRLKNGKVLSWKFRKGKIDIFG
uniref:Uncharacterized protein n=1 Tax=Panagrolaimus sp. ES5 TaxID=591445 RepID=A0AC34G3M2_9BILA